MSFLLSAGGRGRDAVGRTILNRVLDRDVGGPTSILETEFVRNYGQQAWQEFQTLSREPDGAFFYENLLAFAARQEQNSGENLAARVYAEVASEARSVDPGISARAEQRLAALGGKGPFHLKAESLLRSSYRQCFDLGVWGTMGIARTLSQASHAFTLGRLLASPTAGFFSRGPGARAAAGLAAFATDGFAFVSLRHGLESLRNGQPEGLSSSSGYGIAAGVLALGAWRLVQGAGTWFPRSLGGPASWTRAVVSPAAQFTAIYGSHRLAQAWDPNPSMDATTPLFHSLIWLVHSQFADRLSRGVLGPTFFLREPRPSAPQKPWPTSKPAPFAPIKGLAGFQLLLPSRFSPPSSGIVQMTKKPGDGWESLPPSQPISTWPPRLSSVFQRPSNPPARDSESSEDADFPAIEEALEMFIPRRSGELLSPGKILWRLDYLLPSDKVRLVQRALETLSSEEVLQRIVGLAREIPKRSAALHAVRLLQAFYLNQENFPSRPIYKALEQIQATQPPEPPARQAEWVDAKHQLLREWGRGAAQSPEPESQASRHWNFEMELVRFSSLPSPLPLVEDLLNLSMSPEVPHPKARRVMATFAAALALRRREEATPLEQFMTGYHLADRLAERGQVIGAYRVSQRILEESRNWDQLTSLPELNAFLRRRLKFQQQAIYQYLALLNLPANGLQPFYEFYAAHSASHLPKPWGVIRELRERAGSLLSTDRFMEGKNHLELATSLFNNFVLEPTGARFGLNDVQDFVTHQVHLLKIAMLAPEKAQGEWNSPFTEIMDRLEFASDWEGAYRIAEAFYHLNLVDPMVMRNALTSVASNLDHLRHRRQDPALDALSRRFLDLESRLP